MKKIVAIIGMVMLLAGIVWAAEYSLTSGVKSASALIDSGPGLVDMVIIATDGTNSVQFDLMDATSQVQPKITPTMVITTSATDRVKIIPFAPSWRFATGLYASCNSAGTFSYAIGYRKY